MPRKNEVRFAAGTKVSVEKSRVELEMLLSKHGAPKRAVLVDDETCSARVVFRLDGRDYCVVVPMPKPEDVVPQKSSDQPPGWWKWGREKREGWCKKEHEQRTRERWRQLLLIVRAKFEAIASGLSTAEHEFLADMMLPSGQPLLERLLPELRSIEVRDPSAPLLLGQGGPS